MLWKTGDIWFWHKIGHYIVIPTNAGWKSDGTNVMGIGLAKQAAEKYSNLPSRYGKFCKDCYPYAFIEDMRLILVPTKRLNIAHPYLSWKNDSDYDYIKEGLQWMNSNLYMCTQVKEEGKSIYVPILGTGGGNLELNSVKHLMDEILKDPVFIGVTRG
jgi:hypothetical protein